ncbi:MAG TPA: histidine kinase [Candidatus Dormibacteraeota bacterium]|nr:histidine kinase [Candidatus Dormibacteraeota bacterium]
MSRPRVHPSRMLAGRVRRIFARIGRWHRLSIRRRILVAMLAVSVIPLAIFSLAGMAALSGLNSGALKSANTQLEASEDVHLQDLVQSKAQVINNELESVQDEVELVSQSTGERLAQIPTQTSDTSAAAQASAEKSALSSLNSQLALVYHLHPEVAEVWVQLPESGLIAVSPASTVPGAQAATLSALSPPSVVYQAGLTRLASDLNSPHWRSLVPDSAQSVAWTPVYNNPAAGGPTVTVATETSSTNGIDFRVGANITVRNLVSTFLTGSPGHSEGGYGFLVSSDGVLLSYSPGGAADLGLRPKQKQAATVNLVSQKSPWFAVGSSMRIGLSGHQTINLDGEPVAVFYSPLPANQWSLGVGIPVSGIDGSVVGFSQTITHGLVGVTALLLPFLLVLAALVAIMTDVLSRRLLHPLSNLTAASRRIAGGDLNSPVVGSAGPADEIGTLEMALEGMRRRLSGQHQLIEASQRNLEQRVEERTTELRERNDELATLNSVSADLSRSLVLSDVATGAADQLRRLWQLSDVSVYLLDATAPDGIRLVGRSGDGTSGEATRSELRAALAQCDQSPTVPVQVDELVVVPLQVSLAGVGYLVIRQEQLAGRRQIEMLEVVGGQLALALRNAQLFADTREMATLNERNRIAREIHDTLAQGLTGILVQLQAADGWLDREPSRARRAVDHAIDLARSSLQEARRSVWDLRPKALQQTDLAAAIREELARVQEHSRVRTSIDVHGLIDARLTAEVEVAAFRIAQEAIANAVHHGRPSEIEVEMSRDRDTLCLQVSDNGGGFDPAAPRREGAFGITSMRERAAACGGELQVISRAGASTRVILRVPCQVPAAIGVPR